MQRDFLNRDGMPSSQLPKIRPVFKARAAIKMGWRF
jgi:hypothetical protein